MDAPIDYSVATGEHGAAGKRQRDIKTPGRHRCVAEVQNSAAALADVAGALDHFWVVYEFDGFQFRRSRRQFQHFLAVQALDLKSRNEIWKWIWRIDKTGLPHGVSDRADAVGPFGMVFPVR